MSEREKLLKEWHDKARCNYTQYKALVLWRKLKMYLTDEQVIVLSIAWCHHIDVGEGPCELDDEYKKVMEKWQDK